MVTVSVRIIFSTITVAGCWFSAMMVRATIATMVTIAKRRCEDFFASVCATLAVLAVLVEQVVAAVALALVLV